MASAGHVNIQNVKSECPGICEARQDFKRVNIVNKYLDWTKLHISTDTSGYFGKEGWAELEL